LHNVLKVNYTGTKLYSRGANC